MPKNTSTYSSLKKNFEAGKVPANLFLVCSDRIVSDDLLDAAFDGFVGKGESKQDCMPVFTADDLKIEQLMNECMGGGLFSTRKLIVIRNPKKLTKPKRIGLTDYFADPNPDITMIIVSEDEESPEKMILESKEDASRISNAKKNLEHITVSDLSEKEMTDWIREKFTGFEISEESVNHLLSLSNSNLAEILPEIEKLKTFCHFKKSVSIEDINMCNGIARDFSEGEFIRAVIEKDPGTAFKIYSNISLKKDVEVYLVFLLNTSFCAIKKLLDPSAAKLQGFNLQRELKLWGPVHGALLPLYQKVAAGMNPDSVSRAFDLIFSADKRFKSSSAEKPTIMTNLIQGLCSL
jgi:DNA polymerase III delta subunit